MKRTFLFVLLLFCTTFIFAQIEVWQWAKQAGGTDWDEGHSIAIDSSGNSYITGDFRSSSITFGTITLTNSSNESSDIFVAKLDSNGNWLWARQAGGGGWDKGYGIAVDASGNSYVTGSFSGSATFGTTTLTSSIYDCDIFVAKLDSNGNWLWTKQTDRTSSVCGYSIAVDSNGSSYVTGNFIGNTTFGTTTLTSNVSWDIFVAKLDSNGNWLWANQAGGTDWDEGNSIAVDASGNSYVTGYFYNSVSFSTTTLTSSGSYDIFVAKLDSNGNWLWAKRAGGTDWDEGNSIAVDASSNIYVTGYFSISATFGTTTLTSSGYDDIFVAKLDSSGNWLWAKHAGSTISDAGESITVDSSGNSYITGYFKYSASFGTITLTSSGVKDIFVAKLDSNGNWVWAKQTGGKYNDYAESIAVDANGNSYVIGYFPGSATFGTITLTSSGDEDIFVAKL